VVANNVGWSLDLGTVKLAIPMVPSVYENAKSIGYDNAGDPVFQLNGFGCTPIARFQIHSYVRDSQNMVMSLLASFEEHCDFDATRRRTGCVHFSQ
jgi:hypothetical protein